VGCERGDALLPIDDESVKERAVDRVGDPTKFILPRLPALLIFEMDAEVPMSAKEREGSPWALRRGREVEGEVELKGIDIIASRVCSREREEEDVEGATPGMGMGIFWVLLWRADMAARSS
jgi:hypothetical protein